MSHRGRVRMSLRRLSVVSALLLSSALLVPVGGTAYATLVTQSFVSTNAEQQFTVPGDVHVLSVHAVGAPGGCAFGAGGRGGDVVASIAVTPGQVLYVEVGAMGTAASAGFNGGGAGGGFSARGGGGASDVRTVPAAARR